MLSPSQHARRARCKTQPLRSCATGRPVTTRPCRGSTTCACPWRAGCRRSQPGIATCRRASRTLACGRIQSQITRTRQRVVKKITKSRVIMDAVRLLWAIASCRTHSPCSTPTKHGRHLVRTRRPPLSARSTTRTFVFHAVGHGELSRHQRAEIRSKLGGLIVIVI